MRIIVTVSILLLFAITAFSQGTIKGKIIDSVSKQPLGLATVTVFKAVDTVIITYRLSNPEGEFKVPGIPFNTNCRMVISFAGYKVYRKEFLLNETNQQLDLGSVALPSDSKSLDEVLVIAERPPVTFRKDTIEFNASAFKTIPNALLEDLLKKLPGVQVDGDGNITVNGKAVNRILVDGKTFFGDDPKMATRNLPANVIDKVQVTDDKDELLRNGDDNINNVGKVVNITLKKGVKKGWFGKAYAGGGSDQTYEAGAIANIFRDTLQVSLLGYMNDLNKPGFGFSDLGQTGGLNRTGSTMGNRSIGISSSASGSSISINGINFGGAQNGYGGIATSRGAGFNLNHAPTTKKSLYLQYYYGGADIDRLTKTNQQQFNSDTIITNNSTLTGGVLTQTHNIGAGANLKPDSVTTILINTSYKINHLNEDRFNDIYAFNNKVDSLSFGRILQNNISNGYAYSQNVAITRLSRTKKGRRFNIVHTLDVNNNYNDYTTNSNTQFINPTRYDSVLQQLRSERIPKTNATGAFNYSEPIGKKFTLRLGGRYEYEKLSNGISTFNPNGTTAKYDVFNPLLSSRFERESNRFYLTSGFEIKWKKFVITPLLRELFQQVNNSLVSQSTTVKQKQNNLLPGLTVVYKQMNFNLNKDVVLPSYSYLLPVTDNTNPYYVVKGNPSLTPARRYNASLNYFFNDVKKNLNIFVFISGTMTNNDVVQSITVDNRGVQTSSPVNADGSRNGFTSFVFSKQYRPNQKFTLTWNLGGNYNYNRNRLLFNNESSWQSTFNVNHSTGLNFNFNDKLEWNNNFSLGNNFTSYTNPAFQPLKVKTYSTGTELIIRMPKHVIWESNINFYHNDNVPAGVDKDITRWNAAINFTMLKDERGVLRIAVNDILNSNKNINTYTSRNIITTTQGNILPRYVMATFTYNIRAVGAAKQKVGGRNSLFMF